MTSAPLHEWDDWEDEPGRYPSYLDDDGPDDDLPLPPGEVLVCPADVLEFMLPLIGPERAGPMALWCALVDHEDRTLPLVMPISDVPMRPDPELVTSLVGQLREVLQDRVPDGGLVFAVVRRTGGDRGGVEVAWCAALMAAAEHAGVRVRAVAAVGRDRARVLQW
ncbi:hypothetical protein [Cellulomonas rhizosphaerae]|uniref:DUF4192 family protein n=1 Tax=Cellulomonas rhizosphaerae TaxID=2293719 RepID=A0A413RLH6_9CELL|nr:hypothetical protein [Cellulomonas rhizosphaerae]RHA40706.1 hypothetical protein D1825_09815 [Cellulomonas rhizosphaerae]